MVKGFCKSLSAIDIFGDDNDRIAECSAGNMEIQFTERFWLEPNEKIVAVRVDIDICSLPVKFSFVVYDMHRKEEDAPSPPAAERVDS